MSAADLIREVKYKAKIDRDSELAIKLGVGRANISGWLKGLSKPDGTNTLKLAILGDLTLEETLELMTKDEERLKQAGFSTIGMMLTLGVSSLSAMSLLKMSALPYDVLTASFFVAGNCILCKIKFEHQKRLRS